MEMVSCGLRKGAKRREEMPTTQAHSSVRIYRQTRQVLQKKGKGDRKLFPTPSEPHTSAGTVFLTQSSTEESRLGKSRVPVRGGVLPLAGSESPAGLPGSTTHALLGVHSASDL